MTQSYWDNKSDTYQFPGSPVLKNLAEIREQALLDAFEQRATALRLDEVMQAIGDDPVNLALWKKIHQILFQNVYEWAGRIRTVQLAKGTTVFAMPQYIELEGKRIFAEFDREDLILTDTTQLASRFAYYFAELNILHPFREGNGRTQKLLFDEIARRYGYIIEWARIDRNYLLQALITAFQEQDYKILETLFEAALIAKC